MARYTITPWRSQADLLKVRSQLYPTNSTSSIAKEGQQHAVNRILAWKLRGNLPHAVESTALLVDAVLHHAIPGNSSFSIRAVYSAAFCRFVTGFCDIGRHKERTLEPSSMLEIARRIDMPAKFVTLRHEATHEDLPGLQRLVVDTEEALRWLWDVYWQRLDAAASVDNAADLLPALRSAVALVLRDFRRRRLDDLRSKIASGAGATDSATDSTCSELVQLCEGNQVKGFAVAEVFVKERFLFPSNRELHSSLNGAYLIWEDLLRALSLQVPGFFFSLGQHLLEALTQPSSTRPGDDAGKEAFALWIGRLSGGFPGDDADSSSQRAFASKIMNWCCLYPGYWTQVVGTALLARADDDFRQGWQDLFNASRMDASAGSSDEDAAVASSPVTNGHAAQSTSDGAHLLDVDTQYEPGGWRRAVVSSHLPLGVVR